MAGELHITYNATGTLYAIIRKPSSGDAWNGSTWATWADGNIGTYDIPLTDMGGDFYAADKPAGIVDGTYIVTYYLQAGASPDIADEVLDVKERVLTSTSTLVGSSAIVLNAVNQILRGLGQPPVEALDTGGTSEEAEAEQQLDEARQALLLESWNFNTRREQTYSPSAGEIALTNVLSMRPSGSSAWRNLTMIDAKLYDNDDVTDVFTDDVVLDVVLDIPFDQIALPIRNHIVAEAKFAFQIYKKRGVTDARLMEDERMRARVSARRHDTLEARTNLLSTPSNQNLIRRNSNRW